MFSCCRGPSAVKYADETQHEALPASSMAASAADADADVVRGSAAFAKLPALTDLDALSSRDAAARDVTSPKASASSPKLLAQQGVSFDKSPSGPRSASPLRPRLAVVLPEAAAAAAAADAAPREQPLVPRLPIAAAVLPGEPVRLGSPTKRSMVPAAHAPTPQLPDRAPLVPAPLGNLGEEEGISGGDAEASEDGSDEVVSAMGVAVAIIGDEDAAGLANDGAIGETGAVGLGGGLPEHKAADEMQADADAEQSTPGRARWTDNKQRAPSATPPPAARPGSRGAPSSTGNRTRASRTPPTVGRSPGCARPTAASMARAAAAPPRSSPGGAGSSVWRF